MQPTAALLSLSPPLQVVVVILKILKHTDQVLIQQLSLVPLNFKLGQEVVLTCIDLVELLLKPRVHPLALLEVTHDKSILLPGIYNEQTKALITRRSQPENQNYTKSLPSMACWKVVLAPHQVAPLRLELGHLLPQPGELLLSTLGHGHCYSSGRLVRCHPLHQRVSAHNKCKKRPTPNEQEDSSHAPPHHARHCPHPRMQRRPPRAWLRQPTGPRIRPVATTTLAH